MLAFAVAGSRVARFVGFRAFLRARDASHKMLLFTVLCCICVSGLACLAPKCAKMSLAYIPPIPSVSLLHGLRGFLEGSLDVDQAPLKHHPGLTPDPDDISYMA